jgi:aminoglycoside 6'-N-acetyltransferase
MSPAGAGSAAGEPAHASKRRDDVPSVSTLRGERVVLRSLTDADAPALLALLRDPGVAAWWMRATWDQINEQGAVVFAVLVDGEVAGSIQYHEESDPDYRSAAIDIFVGDAWQGRGLGTEAMRVLIDHLVRERGHHRITVDPAVANQRAVRVYERLGFRRVGVMRAYERVADGTWRDALLLELIVGV